MYELPRTIPDVKMLLALAPEELASTIHFFSGMSPFTTERYLGRQRICATRQ
jgi:hypothetical protein